MTGMANIRNDVPSVHSFPDVLTFVAQDDGNEREVKYYRADAYLSFCARVQEVFELPRNMEQKKNWGDVDDPEVFELPRNEDGDA